MVEETIGGTCEGTGDGAVWQAARVTMAAAIKNVDFITPRENEWNFQPPEVRPSSNFGLLPNPRANNRYLPYSPGHQVLNDAFRIHRHCEGRSPVAIQAAVWIATGLRPSQ